ncbi:hypothetical protein E2C01_003799 [Portunus trituberculatus]|uniref:Uncharacterized protein n=1 Tax=Portunus trituberculatus TaxID=210409 RepID=A0A5B7CN30_PORTR|nr:hypothetical protein [Portunus trituberculatus]
MVLKTCCDVEESKSPSQLQVNNLVTINLSEVRKSHSDYGYKATKSGYVLQYLPNSGYRAAYHKKSKCLNQYTMRKQGRE